MQITLSPYADFPLMLAVFAALSGCKAKESASMADTTSTAVNAKAADTSATSGSVAAPSGAALSDANIVAPLDEANMADSALGPTALPKATRADVKNFAKLMMGEHHALRLASTRWRGAPNGDALHSCTRRRPATSATPPCSSVC